MTVRGTVRANKFWRDRGFRLKFSPLAETERWASSRPTLYLRDLEPDAADPDLLHWSTELSCEGSWQVAAAPFRVNRDFTASAHGTEVVELSFGEPAELAVSVKDAVTGEILPSVGVTYEYVGSSRSRAMMYSRVDYNPVTARHQLAIPAGHVVLRVSAQAHQSVEEELQLSPGEHELSFELDPVGGVDFSFYDGVTACPLNLLELEIEATHEEALGDIYEVWIHTLTFSESGTYRVRFSQLPGYLPVETTVEVPSVGRIPHEVHLMRE